MPDTSHEFSEAANEQLSQHGFDQRTGLLPVGTIILTLRGALPVEDLHRGDRVCTRAGAFPVRRVKTYGQDHIALHLEGDESAYVLDEKYCNQYRQTDD
ncbi:MAG: Hint domain-containing protein [Paracoccaceae bacterium]